MKLGIQWRHELPPQVVKELEALISGIAAWTSVEHDDDGGHGDVTATSVEINQVRGTALNVIRGLSSLGGAVSFSGSLTPPALTADANNYSPVGIRDTFVLRVTPDGADRTITGIQEGPTRAPQPGRMLLVFNADDTNDLNLAHESSASTDVFRFLLPGLADLSLPPNNGALLYYETRSARWICLAGTPGAGVPTFTAGLNIDPTQLLLGVIATLAAVAFDSVAVGGSLVSGAVLSIHGQYHSPTVLVTSSGSAQTLDWRGGTERDITLDDNCTLTFSNPVSGGRYILTLKQDATGSRTVTWPANVKWPAGIAPVLSTAPGTRDLVTFLYLSVPDIYLGAFNLNYL